MPMIVSTMKKANTTFQERNTNCSQKQSSYKPVPVVSYASMVLINSETGRGVHVFVKYVWKPLALPYMIPGVI